MSRRKKFVGVEKEKLDIIIRKSKSLASEVRLSTTLSIISFVIIFIHVVFHIVK